MITCKQRAKQKRTNMRTHTYARVHAPHIPPPPILPHFTRHSPFLLSPLTQHSTKQATHFPTIPHTVLGLPHPHSQPLLPLQTPVPPPPPTPRPYARNLSRLHLPLSRHLTLPLVLSHTSSLRPPSSSLPHSTHRSSPHRYNDILPIRRTRK